MCLFELPSQLRYKLQQKIGKALQWCSDAIWNAFTQYNTQASLLGHPTLSWKDIAEYSLLGEFNLIHYSCADIRDCDWAKPENHEATEIRITVVIQELSQRNPPIGIELQQQWRSYAAINVLHIHQLDQITSLRGFSGDTRVGVCSQTCDEHMHLEDEQLNNQSIQRGM
ncbi:hypothetical protein PAXRUDRAFT_36284 [Paxillus rubicundulus Ve08.2h10]|uniref:Uncharacterized protein n=1 Tax=Paxillus rubicundulus Ve08.2h10 TaxID=930991 RepID=A0A0D0CX33_9AGAM|nr:hypothetical protein PAXRUDRAFT_36284 [Paxillus rubicundulus Ve08.2h10]